MSLDFLLKDEYLKSLGLALPIITTVWQAIKYAFDFLKNGKAVRLKKLHKDYADFLGEEEKNYIKKILRKKVMRQIIDVNNDATRTRLIYISNRCDIDISSYTLSILSKFLKYNGKRFYFEINKKLKTKRLLNRFLSALYFIYSFTPLIIYFTADEKPLPLSVACLLFVMLFLFGIVLLTGYPKDKKIQSINGNMLQIDGTKYRGP